MLDLEPKSYLVDWFSRQSMPVSVIDVGAADGDFAAEMRQICPAASLLLVEPFPASANKLRSRFGNDANIDIVSVALSNVAGTRDFHVYPESTQNSLMMKTEAVPEDVIRVEVSTLDDIVEKYKVPGPLFIKIDTQGQDLQVLQGGRDILRRYKPLIQVEVIFSSLYQEQCSPADLMRFMYDEGYSLADFSMQHTDAQGRLAYADWIFTPESPAMYLEAFYCRDSVMLAEQLAIQKKAAQDRLELIRQLDAACKERLALIESLSRKLKQK
jgi:FkbM family methyltransferase